MTITVEQYLTERVATMTERELQDHIIDAARKLQWLAYHPHRSQHSEAGFPDLMLIRHGRCIVAELKREQTERGRRDREPTAMQRRWLAEFELLATSCEQLFGQPVQVYLWRPSHWLSGEIQDVLDRPGGAPGKQARLRLEAP